MSNINKILSNCVFKYGKLNNLERTLNDVTLGFNTLYNYNDIYEHEYHIFHCFKTDKERIASFGNGQSFKDRAIVDKELQQIKVTCFSRTANNNILWSHYSDKHKGIIYCFDKDEMFIHSGDVLNWGEVKYSSHIPEVNMFEGHITKGILKINIETVVLTKSLEWAYEKEIRYYFYQDDFPRNYNSLSLKAVIIGRRTGDEDIEKIKCEVKKFNSEHKADAKILYACREPRNYSLGIVEHKERRDSSEKGAVGYYPVLSDIDDPL